jgi:small subunit ribosomal protein S20
MLRSLYLFDCKNKYPSTIADLPRIIGRLRNSFWQNFSFLISLFTAVALPLPSKFKEYMANHKATKKDMRQSAKRREKNRYTGKTTRNAIRDLKASPDKATAGKSLPEVISMIDKLAKTGVIHKNKASNLKSKLTRRVNALA